MTIFYNGVLDFEGDRITIHRLAKHQDTASLDCTLTWLGSIWSFSATGKKQSNAVNTFTFEAHSWNISKGRPGEMHETPSTLTLSFEQVDDELDVTGTWGEQDEEYEVSGLLAPFNPAER